MAEMVDIELITIGERLRAVDQDHVAVIADSIRQCGRVLQPITISRKFATRDALRPEMTLLAGAHRLAAAKLAGLDVIPAEIVDDIKPLQAKLIEIDENLLRHELNPLDRAVFLAERKRIYEELHPETKAGVAGAKAKHGSASDTMSFAKDAADRLGFNPRTIERSVKIATSLSPEVRKNLVGTDLSKNQSELLLLAKQEPDAQIKIVELILDQKHGVKSVKAALERTSGKPKVVADTTQAEIKKLMDAWRHSGLTARRTFVRELSAGDRLLLQDLLDMANPDTEEAA
ncbi:ParB/RepB/Spo0J family partition protein [Thalassospira sp.]|uniref:ParB/RepB/Spo0J family partition protein n=1 Tax=Thalassospira sp. TaxID=1912094 RepID=UPI000C5ECA44|nr:ParB/RepB/Spo0J family partition protein [Thalassospira sp.]MBC06325.1 hypothetical protein [Thalassospira sp.]|tara:strand:+ start:24 stop:887 length:864 start_codon:yes stop_codon:yes gene_type:complete